VRANRFNGMVSRTVAHFVTHGHTDIHTHSGYRITALFAGERGKNDLYGHFEIWGPLKKNTTSECDFGDADCWPNEDLNATKMAPDTRELVCIAKFLKVFELRFCDLRHKNKS
jgi:hypothetical protein